MRRYNLLIFHLMLFLSLPSFASAETFSGKVRRGNALFQERKYPESLKKYQEAQVESPADERVMFNLGNAQYKLNEYENALSEYSQAAQAEDNQLRAQSHYNAGNALYRMGKLEEAVDQYLKALEFDPKDEDAKYNLEFVRQEISRRMNEQQQRQKEQQKQKDRNQQKQDQRENQDTQKEESKSQDKQGQPGEQQQQKSDEAKQQQEKPSGQNGQQQQPAQREESDQANESAGGGNDKAMRSLPSDKMSQENIDRYLHAIEAESAENMKDFLRRQQPVEASAVSKDW